MNVRQRRGFTLIELLVSVAIIAVLSAVGLSIFTNAQRRARDARRRADLNAVRDAAEQLFLNCGKYPDDTTEFVNATTGCTDSGVVQYLQTGQDTASFPSDPRGGSTDPYEVVSASTTAYKVCADQEIDPTGVVDGDWAAGTNENDFCVNQRQ